MTVAKGLRRHNGMRTIAIHFDPDTFEQVRRRAVREGTSFGEQIRLLVEWGLESEAAAEPPFERDDGPGSGA